MTRGRITGIPHPLKLFCHIFLMAIPLCFLLYGIYFDLILGLGKREDRVVLLILGWWGGLFLFLFIRFFKLIFITENKIIIIYPFTFQFKKINRESIVGYNTFEVPMIRYMKDQEFTHYKTIDGTEFVISEFIFSNYYKLKIELNKNIKESSEIHFLKKKHLIVAITLFFISIFFLAYIAG